jgi:hypothetical protein
MTPSDPFQKPPPQHTSPRKGILEEKEGMNQIGPFQKEPESRVVFHHAAAAVSPNTHHQGSEASLFTIDHDGKPPPNPAQTLEEQDCKKLASQQPSLDLIAPRWHRDIHLFARQSEE